LREAARACCIPSRIVTRPTYNTPPSGLLRWLPRVLAAALLFCEARASTITLEELLKDPEMNPKRFAGHFEDFAFLFNARVERPEIFLSKRAGDCDDYAVLADLVLKQKGFNTRLVRVALVGRNVGHAICYVDDKKVYLDYNNRNYFSNLEKAKPFLRDIAEKVAESLEANWSYASEYTYDYKTDRKVIVTTVVKTEPPEKDPDRKARP
jgi:hypothetical protein